jgi:hypothetical protein
MAATGPDMSAMVPILISSLLTPGSAQEKVPEKIRAHDATIKNILKKAPPRITHLQFYIKRNDLRSFLRGLNFLKRQLL